MRIGIDVRYLSHGLMGGVHTYVAHLVPALLERASDCQVFLYADTKCPLELTELPENVTVRRLPWSGPHSSIYLDFALRRYMQHDRLDVAHFPANYGFGPSEARTVITLHDAMNILPLREIVEGSIRGSGWPTVRGLAMSAYLHWCTKAAVARADLILTDSSHAASEIKRVGGISDRRIIVAPLAPSPEVRRVVDPARLAEVKRRLQLPRPFVVADALKNPEVLIRAWRLLPTALRERRDIVFFSRRPNPLPIIRESVAAGESHLLIRPSRQDLIALYSAADAFVFPSWLEGFGLPVLEAMACGAPVVASDRGSIPEIAGDAAALVDAEDAGDLSRALGRVLSKPEEAARLRAAGLARAAQFSWAHTAETTFAAYERACQVPTGGRAMLDRAAAGDPTSVPELDGRFVA